MLAFIPQRSSSLARCFFLLLCVGLAPWSLSAEDITSKVPEKNRAKIVEASPSAAPAKPQKDRRLLVFSRTKGFRHSSIPHGVFAMATIGTKSGAFTIEHSEDPAVFAAENLARFDAVLFLNTTGSPIEDQGLREALLAFVKSGKGFAGIHAASDTFYDWPAYGDMVGAYFDGHPWHETVRLRIEDPTHPCNQCFGGDTYDVKDEIYQYKDAPYSRERLRVLYSLDPSGTNMKKGGMKRKDGDYAVGWVQRYGEGRVFYSNLGHREDTYENPVVLAHFLAGLQFAFGDLAADTTPSAALARGSVLAKGARLAIVGDSITEQKLYSKFIEAYLLACTPQLEVQCFQFGWGGERAPGFANRMDNDLVFWKPTVVTTCFGMNDGSYRAYEDSIGATYEKGMQRIVDRMKEIGAKVVVGSPGVVDAETFASGKPEFDKVYNDNLARLSGIAKDLAAAEGFPYADVNGAMMRAMEAAQAALGKTYHVGGRDGVHPAANGHLVMAQAFLEALGLDGEIGTIRVDLKDGKVGVTEGHSVVRKADGEVELESARYPFVFEGDERDPGGTRSILPFCDFNERLNRLTLVVTGLDAESAKVSWGEASKSFSREALAKGINLAQEFTDTPFDAAFRGVLEAVARKQAYETPMIKDQITRFRFWTSRFGDDAEVSAALETLRGKLMEKNDELHRSAKAAVKPVRHVIRVTPQ